MCLLYLHQLKTMQNFLQQSKIKYKKSANWNEYKVEDTIKVSGSLCFNIAVDVIIQGINYLFFLVFPKTADEGTIGRKDIDPICQAHLSQIKMY